MSKVRDDLEEGKLEFGPVSLLLQDQDQYSAVTVSEHGSFFGSRKFNLIIQRDEASTVAPKIQIPNVQPPLSQKSRKEASWLPAEAAGQKLTRQFYRFYLLVTKRRQPFRCLGLSSF